MTTYSLNDIGHGYHATSGCSQNVVLIDASDNVGIGTSTPSSKLEVNGNINLVYINCETNNFINALCITNHNFSGINFGSSNNGSTIVGVDAGPSLRYNGLYNVAYGYRSSYNITTGCCTVCIGTMAGYSLTTANFNTAIGHTSLYNTTGEKNVGLGISSGYDNTSGTKNIYIGTDCQNSGSINRTNTNEIVIGADGRGNGSDTTTLGNTNTTDTYIHGNILVNQGSNTNPIWKSIDVSRDFIITSTATRITRTDPNSSNIHNFGVENTSCFLWSGSYGLQTFTNGVKIASPLYAGYRNVVVTGGYSPSDDRLKFNETSISDALSVINRLNPQVYDFAADGLEYDTRYREAGFIAQEVETIQEISYAARPPRGHGEDFYHLHYQTLFTYAVKAIQELHQLVKTQQTLIETLQARVEILEAK